MIRYQPTFFHKVEYEFFGEPCFEIHHQTGSQQDGIGEKSESDNYREVDGHSNESEADHESFILLSERRREHHGEDCDEDKRHGDEQHNENCEHRPQSNLRKSWNQNPPPLFPR